MRNNCFVGNSESIAPVVVDEAQVFASGSFLQRTSSEVAPTGCEFISKVKTGSLLESEFEWTDFDCLVYSRTNICTASIARNFTTSMPCEEKLEDIFTNEVNVLSTKIVRTYILCPDTNYNVGSSPIVIGQPNTHVICGINGDSNNDCILKGGSVQLMVSDQLWTGRQHSRSRCHFRAGQRDECADQVSWRSSFSGLCIFEQCKSGFHLHWRAGSVVRKPASS